MSEHPEGDLQDRKVAGGHVMTIMGSLLGWLYISLTRSLTSSVRLRVARRQSFGDNTCSRGPWQAFEQVDGQWWPRPLHRASSSEQATRPEPRGPSNMTFERCRVEDKSSNGRRPPFFRRVLPIPLIQAGGWKTG